MHRFFHARCKVSSAARGAPANLPPLAAEKWQKSELKPVLKLDLWFAA
jgi:hypothetical protein